MYKIGVLGAGTWGMALARMLCNAGNDVTVWSALGEEIDAFSSTRRHPNLPDMVIPDELAFTKSIDGGCRRKIYPRRAGDRRCGEGNRGGYAHDHVRSDPE